MGLGNDPHRAAKYAGCPISEHGFTCSIQFDRNIRLLGGLVNIFLGMIGRRLQQSMSLTTGSPFRRFRLRHLPQSAIETLVNRSASW